MSVPEKVILFNGKDLDNWTTRDGNAAGWSVEDGITTVTAKTGDIMTKEVFGDCLLHVEFRIPDMPEAQGQAKGNSGVYIHGRYEIQVLDSYGLEPGKGDCSAVYDCHAPLFNACKPAAQWQSYDIIFRTARFDDDGNLTEKPRLTLLHNGMPVHNNIVLENVTGGAMGDICKEGPLLLQDHGNAVSYRNIYVYRLPEKGLDRY